MRVKIGAAVAALTMMASQAQASLALVTSQTNDAAFEGAGGFLQSYYGLPLAGSTALPPLERVVGQVTGSTTSNNTGLYVPNASSGLPGQGSGVTTALTNHPPVGGGGMTPWTSGTPVLFSISRSGTTMTFTVGGLTYSDTQPYYGGINGLELRARSQPVPSGAYTADSLSYSNLVYTDAVTTSQSLPAVSAANGAVLVNLYSGITGEFRLAGSATLTWAGAANPPPNSQVNGQLKALALPVAVPEPASLVLLAMALSWALIGRLRR